jgi:hypothetical protein
MTEFLQSLKSDLLDRRLLPLVALVTVALVGALAYVLLSGGGGAAAPQASVAPTPATPGSHGLLASQTTTSAARAVAETVNGAPQQRRGSAHNPFTPLPGAATAATSKVLPATSASKAASATGTGSTSGASSKSEAPKTESSTPSSGGSSKPSKPAKPKAAYSVAVQFGVLPPGTSAEAASLQSFLGLSKATPLPSKKERLIEFLGVTVSGASRSASFAIEAELLPSPGGSATCLPSPVQCKVINLKEGRTEQLLYLSPSGQTVTYELRVVSIAPTSASSAAVKRALSAQVAAAGHLLSGNGLLSLSGMRYSSLVGGLTLSAANGTARHLR